MTQEKKQEYLNRWLGLKPQIESDYSVLGNIVGVFDYLYRYKKLPKSVVELGEGESHILYNVGQVGELEIALRITKWSIKLIYTSDILLKDPKSDLEDEIACFVDAYVSDRNPPLFVGIINWKDYLAILTEDVSKCGKLRLESVSWTDFDRINDDGTKERFFLDPHISPGCFEDSQEYLSESGRINIPRFLWMKRFSDYLKN